MRAVGIIAALAAASTVHAHATFQYLWFNGVDQGNKCVRPPASNSPVTSVSTNDLACNVNGNIAAAATCTVAAGSRVAVEMHQQPGDRTCTTEAIGGNHDGPTIIYMAKVNNAATAIGSDASWFKVNNTGLIKTDYWGTDDMNANCGRTYFTVPADITPGDYLVRAEVIALHVAGSVGGAQFYMSCYQLTVTGGGSASPSTVKFPGAYSATDPGILFDIYGSYTTYTIPGPPVYTPGAGGGGGGSSSTAKPTTTTAKPTTANPTTTKPTTTSTTAPPAGTGTPIQKYGQCGGTGWTGSTLCASGSTCTKVNDYYYQCL